jgi:fused signal recognition particle receptor
MNNFRYKASCKSLFSVKKRQRFSYCNIHHSVIIIGKINIKSAFTADFITSIEGKISMLEKLDAVLKSWLSNISPQISEIPFSPTLLGAGIIGIILLLAILLILRRHRKAAGKTAVMKEAEELAAQKSEIELAEPEVEPLEEAPPELPPEEIEIPPEAEEIEEPVTRESLFRRLKNGLSKTNEKLVGKIEVLFNGQLRIDDDLLEELEEILVTGDLGINTALNLLDNIREMVSRKEIDDAGVLKSYLKQKIFDILSNSESPFELTNEHPFVIMVIGVNGVGKTTTIAKMARQFKKDGKSVMLAAGDTFRAAAIEQLEIWAQRVGADIIKQKSGADPGAVVFDAIHAAKARNADVLIVDTAGRLHTKVNLMEELKKVKRVTDKEHPGAPHEILLVLDATTGQNAINQAKIFNDALSITGIAVTKLDGTAKGGVIVGICDELGLPVRYIGIGEKMDDLRPFIAEDFVEALFD